MVRISRLLRHGLIVLVILLLILFIGFRWILYPQFAVANGYAAKLMCSCAYIADRNPASIQAEDLDLGPIANTKTAFNHKLKTATSSMYGLNPRTAVYSGNRGCVLLVGKSSDAELQTFSNESQLEIGMHKPEAFVWPSATGIDNHKIEGVDYDQLSSLGDRYFSTEGTMNTTRTRAIVFIYKDSLIYEKYANGFDENTPILGWSMTKSICATLVGILVKNGRTALDRTNLFEQWQDERSKISLRDLLQMQSGLEFNESYSTISDATRMLFISEDVSAIPLTKPQIYKPGVKWDYSSGTTNLLSRYIYETIANRDNYLNFPYDSLFQRIGMSSAIMETDESGLFIASSFMYATPRDWAKFGLLYLKGGNWQGEQIIDSNWVDFVRTPAPESNGIYGGQFWLNKNHSAYPDAPEDLYSCNGFQGQYIFIIPSYDAIIVRMGLAEEPAFNVNGFLKDVLSSIESS